MKGGLEVKRWVSRNVGPAGVVLALVVVAAVVVFLYMRFLHKPTVSYRGLSQELREAREGRSGGRRGQ